MSNKIATATSTFAHPSINDANISEIMTTSVPFIGQTSGAVDVPAGASDNTCYQLPFGGVESPTYVRFRNNTDVEVKVKFNGSGDGFHLAVGAVVTFQAPAMVDSCPLAAIDLQLKDTATLGGTFDYWVHGDPTV